MAATELEAGLATMVEVARHTTAVVHPARRALMPYRDMADTAAMDTELAGAALCAQRTTGALALRAVWARVAVVLLLAALRLRAGGAQAAGAAGSTVSGVRVMSGPSRVGPLLQQLKQRRVVGKSRRGHSL